MESGFSHLHLIEPILRAVNESGYKQPTPIQSAAIPVLLGGEDLLGCAQTGTGKTAAFALPLLQHIARDWKSLKPKQPRILILSPTRELAIQIADSFKTYGKYLDIKTAVIFGGVGQTPQVQALSRGVDILVATPGRLLDLIQQRYLDIRQIEIFVLDEADRMLDMGFIADVKKILPMLPQKRQNLFFSATMSPEIKKLAANILSNPKQIAVTPVASTVDLINQSVMYVDKTKKRDLLRHLLKDNNLSKVIVFTRTKHGANRVAETLQKNGISSAAIHGNKSQSARQTALENFKQGKVRVLVATDIAARGIDIDDVTHVINFEIPNVSEDYVHRIGRTARAGTKGVAVSFSDAEEKSFIRDIEKLIGKQIPLVTDHPYHSTDVERAAVLSKGKAKAILESKENSGQGFNRNNRRRRPRHHRHGGSKPSRKH